MLFDIVAGVDQVRARVLREYTQRSNYEAAEKGRGRK